MFVRRFLAAVVLAASAAGLTAAAQDKKNEPKKDEPRKGSVTGVVAAKGDPAKNEYWIEVKADGEEKGRKYFPQWKGGAPNQGGGPDKETVAKVKETTVGSRVKLDWFFEERPRVEKLEVLKKAAADPTPEKKK